MTSHTSDGEDKVARPSSSVMTLYDVSQISTATENDDSSNRAKATTVREETRSAGTRDPLSTTSLSSSLPLVNIMSAEKGLWQSMNVHITVSCWQSKSMTVNWPLLLVCLIETPSDTLFNALI